MISGGAIAGLGVALPGGVITNADLERRMDTSDDWIVERTGIRERRQAAPDERTSTLAIAAGAAAIKDAGLTPADIDTLLVATCTPDQPIPSTAAFVQDALGLRAAALDINAACSGFVYGLVMASSMVSASAARRVLVVGAEVLTRIVDPTDRGTAILFGDGAGAAIVTQAPPGAGLIASDLGCDGSAAAILQLRADQEFVEMEGREVFRRAVRAVVDSAATTLDQAGVEASQIDCFIPHQANARIVDAAIARLGIPAEKTFMNIERYGNTSAASVPIALAEAVEAGRVREGDLVLLSGFGAGMTWATVLLRWSRGA